MITELDAMMIERLQTYQRNNKQTLPERIFVYRDGVSEVRRIALAIQLRTNEMSTTGAV
jgi:hypothetical protein